MKLKSLFLAGLLALAPTLAHAAGAYTTGAPVAAFPPTGNETIPADTNLPGGANPQIESMTLSYMHAWARPFVSVPYVATWTPDYALSTSQSMTLTGNITVGVPLNPVSGGTLRLVLTQDATGSRLGTFNAIFKFPGGTAPTLSTTAAFRDIVTCQYDGLTATWLCATPILGVR